MFIWLTSNFENLMAAIKFWNVTKIVEKIKLADYSQLIRVFNLIFLEGQSKFVDKI